MLQITLTPGEYFVINGSIVVQLHWQEGQRAHLAVDAPREVPVVRGAVLEREGGARPGCLLEVPEQKSSWVLWNEPKREALRGIRKILDRMEAGGNAAEARAIRQRLDRLTQPGKP